MFAQKHDSALVKLNLQIIQINLTTNNYQEILKGFPQTASLKSGLVTLMPNQNVGEHSTENNEEMIVVLEGECDLIIKNGKIFHLRNDIISYAPAHTIHDVKNNSTKPVKYIYIVTKI